MRRVDTTRPLMLNERLDLKHEVIRAGLEDMNEMWNTNGSRIFWLLVTDFYK
jgi:hypothetical protein